jgi:hypothetical protein
MAELFDQRVHGLSAPVFTIQRASIRFVVFDMAQSALGYTRLLIAAIIEGRPPAFGWLAIGEIRMTSPDDWKKMVRRNKLLGMWAAEKLGITGPEAEAYSDALAVGTLDPERSDVLGKIRKDFAAAGVMQSDEEIVRIVNELTLQAGNQMPVTRGGAADALPVMLAKKLKSE